MTDQIAPPELGPVSLAEHAERLAEGVDRMLNDWPSCSQEVIDIEAPVIERFLREYRMALGGEGD